MIPGYWQRPNISWKIFSVFSMRHCSWRQQISTVIAHSRQRKFEAELYALIFLRKKKKQYSDYVSTENEGAQSRAAKGANMCLWPPKVVDAGLRRHDGWASGRPAFFQKNFLFLERFDFCLGFLLVHV